jgi:hypothetical protein
LSEDTIAMNGAIQRVGRSLYAENWIGKLSERERWLVKRYIDSYRKDRVSSIVPGTISYTVDGQQWIEPTLMAEVHRARDRRDWKEAQYEAVFEWLQNHGFDLDSDRINRVGFEKALAACFKVQAEVRRSPSDASGSSATAAPPSAAGPIYRTGVAGKPTSWHLIAGECRRRYVDGERHHNALTRRESPSGWACVLIKWLGANHPNAPRITYKALTNKLPALLRELAGEVPS